MEKSSRIKKLISTEFLSRNKHLILLIIFLISQIQIINISAESRIHYKNELEPNFYDYMKVRIYDGEYLPIFFEGNGTVDFYILNRTEFADFLENKSISPLIKEINTSKFEYPLTIDKLNDGVHFQVSYNENTNESYIDFFVVIYNFHTNQNIKFVFNINYHSELFDFFSGASLLALIILTISIIILLNIRIRKNKREGEEFKAKMLKGYSRSLMILLLIYLIWQIDLYYTLENNASLFGDPIAYLSVPFKTSITWVTVFTLIGIGFMNISFTVQFERIQYNNPKKYYFTYLMIGTLLLFIIASFIRSIFITAFWIYFISFLVVSFRLSGYYYIIIKNSSGVIRLKTFFILLGGIGIYISIILRPFFIPENISASQLLGNMLTIISITLFYFGAI